MILTKSLPKNKSYGEQSGQSTELYNLSYTHFTVNHIRWFVDPATGAHTQHLERAWLTYKSIIWSLRENQTEKLL